MPEVRRKAIRSLLIARVGGVGFDKDPIELQFSDRPYSALHFVGHCEAFQSALVGVAQSARKHVDRVFGVAAKVESIAVFKTETLQLAEEPLLWIWGEHRDMPGRWVVLILEKVDTA